jgi:hypothetical protein
MIQLADTQGESRTTQRDGALLNLAPCEWNGVFRTRRPNLDYNIENIPYITVREMDENVVRTVMQDPDESNVCSPQVDMVEAYCIGASLEALEVETGEADKHLIGFLDDWKFDEEGGSGRQRLYRGPLTARSLYRELKKTSKLPVLMPCNLAA